MKAKLIIANWLFGWALLAFVGNSIVMAIIAVGWVGGSSWLLNKNRVDALRWVDRFDKWIDKLINK